MKNHDYNSSADYSAKQKAELYQTHLSKIYCVYSHLAERFSELTGNELFDDWSGAVSELISRSESQLELLDSFYQLLGQQPHISREEKLIQFLETNFDRVQTVQTPKALRKHYLLSYLHYASGILLASFQLLHLTQEATFTDEVRLSISTLFSFAQKQHAILSVLQ